MPNAISFNNYFGLTELTNEIQFIPNQWSRISELGIFTPRGTPQDSVTIDRVDGTLNVLNAAQRGGQPAYGKNEIVKTYSYPLAFYSLNDRVGPSDVQGRRRPGSAAGTDMVDEAVGRKLSTLRKSHAQTHEYMMMSALKGQVVSPDGTVFADLYSDFGFTQKVIDFLLGTSTTDVDAKIRELIRHIEDNSYAGGSVGGIRVLVSQEFFDKLISHESIREAYLYFQAANQAGGGQPLRDDLRRSFSHQGVVFEEYRGSVVKMDGATERFIDADDGYAFPTGVEDMFEIWQGPAHHINYANTVGEELYSWSVLQPDGSGIELYSQSAPLPLCRRPQALVKVTTSN